MSSMLELAADLRAQGYSVDLGADVTGKSRVRHKVDLLAKRSGDKTVVAMEGRPAGDATYGIVALFAVAYDVGATAYYVASEKIAGDDLALAKSYHISVVEPD
ncbi:MAG TPA: hypothetical protein VMV28_03620 [Thermoplasmata archaeon]|nr:hypothetical protein [Thermoplasmata archaeon]